MNDMRKDCAAYIYDVDRRDNDEFLIMLNAYYYQMPNIDNHIVINSIVYTVKSIAFNYDENKIYIFVKKRY